ncbi:MAG: hypothetical protein ACJ71Z_08830 [Aeromicrobium sp.]
MERKTAVLAVSVLLAVIGASAWYHLSTDAGRSPSAPGATATPTATATPSADEALVEGNRGERQGPSWSPADLIGKEGRPLTMGKIVPGGLQPVMAGASVQDAIATGFIEPDPKRSESCEGTFWKWKGQLADGFDILVGADERVTSLGLRKDGLETAEGISVGNSYGALKKTYGDRLQGPERMDYGQAGAFLQDDDKWIGFSMDNKPGKLDDSSHIAFIEVTSGQRPSLVRDGC